MPVFLKRIAMNLLALGVGVLLALALAEIALIWLMPPPIIYREPQPSFDYDARLGWKLRPRQHSFTLSEPVTTNALGLRSPEVDGPPAAGERRILCLGDSQTFGNGVGQERTYPRRLEVLLAPGREGERFTVVNAGVPGYDTLQEVDLLERLLPVVRPEVVVVGFYLNDINEAAYADKSQVMDQEKGTFRRQGSAALLSEETIHLLKRSRLVTLLYWQLRQLGARGKTNLFYLPLQGKTDPLLEQGWSHIEAALQRAKALVEAQGGRLAVFPIPDPQDFLGSYPAERYRSRLLSLAARLGVTAFDPTPEMKASGRGFSNYFLAWDGHINEAAHQHIAERLGEALELTHAARAGSP
jgi:lysophospholipase L1-like esterase